MEKYNPEIAPVFHEIRIRKTAETTLIIGLSLQTGWKPLIASVIVRFRVSSKSILGRAKYRDLNSFRTLKQEQFFHQMFNEKLASFSVYPHVFCGIIRLLNRKGWTSNRAFVGFQNIIRSYQWPRKSVLQNVTASPVFSRFPTMACFPWFAKCYPLGRLLIR